MPVVRIMGWLPDESPSVAPVDLPRFLADRAGMDRSEAADAVGRLMKGKSVEVHFDLGEEAAAKAFMSDLRRFGRESQFYGDNLNAWYGDRPRPWFVKYAFGGLIVLLPLWIALNWVSPGSIASRVATVALLGFAISVPFLAGIRK